ncbi:kinase-like domain-containing protein [Xylaria sp. FL1777]|nr:kinase-like domain-containing protein [Xylaria sp. FL1777]
METSTMEVSIMETSTTETLLNQPPVSQSSALQSPKANGKLDKACESTNNVPDTDSSISQPHDHVALGSDLWSGADYYSANTKLNIQARKFFDAVNWQALALIATGCRDGIRCSYVDSDGFSVGQFNMVRRLDFVDGVRWVARIRLPPEATSIPLERYDSPRAFEIEIASMKFFKSKSTIPVPDVFAYDHDPSNQVGAPYMLIEYIHGSAADDLRSIKKCENFGTPEQDYKFRQQMAKIQAQVLMFQFSKIGSLYYDGDTENFYIGPDVDTGKGPWTSSADYYRDLADVLMKVAAARYHRNPEDNTYFCAPVLLNHLMSIHSKGSDGPYNLINRDFGAHNILVDNEFNIVGVIDLDGVFAAPPEAAAQYPRFSGLQVEPPGITVTNPYALERIESTKPQLAQYKELLMKYEAELGNGNATISSLLGSRGALIHYGFEDCGGLVGFQNKVWFQSALAMLREYVEA